MRSYLSLLLILGLLSCQGAPTPGETPKQETPPPKAGLQGAWKVTEISQKSPDGSWTDENPQPGLYVFTERHYSSMYVPSGPEGSQPRALFAGDLPVIGTMNPTDAEKIAAFDSLIANSGTYEVSGSKIMYKPMVAKYPNVSASGGLSETFQLNGDTLKLTFNPPWAPDTETVTTLSRLE